jgi:hypothetical protein
MNSRPSYCNILGCSYPSRRYRSGARRAIRREAAAESIFRNSPRLDELQQIIGATGFRADAGEHEPTEWLSVHQGAGDLAIDIEIADEELALNTRDIFRTARIQTSRQRVPSAVGDF